MLSDRCLSVLSVCDVGVLWIKMKLGTKVGLGPGHIILDGDPAPSLRMGGTAATKFSVHVLWPNGWMDQDATRYGGRPWPRPHCVRWGPAPPPPQKRGIALPSFWPMSIVAKRLNGSICHSTWYGGRPRPRPHCIRWGPSSPKRSTAYFGYWVSHVNPE